MGVCRLSLVGARRSDMEVGSTTLGGGNLVYDSVYFKTTPSRHGPLVHDRPKNGAVWSKEGWPVLASKSKYGGVSGSGERK